MSARRLRRRVLRRPNTGSSKRCKAKTRTERRREYVLFRRAQSTSPREMRYGGHQPALVRWNGLFLGLLTTSPTNQASEKRDAAGAPARRMSSTGLKKKKKQQRYSLMDHQLSRNKKTDARFSTINARHSQVPETTGRSSHTNCAASSASRALKHESPTYAVYRYRVEPSLH